ncbi:hypothetical protein Q7P37_002000 [Cladosporium fusiforme]
MPAALTSQQKAMIAEFVQVTQADPKTAAKLLQKHGWNTSAAINSHFNNPSSSASHPARKPLEQIFDQHRTNPKESPNELNIEGTGALLEELEIGLEDIGSLIFFELTKSPQIGVITREGFVNSPFLDANADSLPKIRNYVLAQRAEISRDWELFKRVYNHTFTLMIEERKKAIDLDQAEGFWRVLFSKDGWAWATERTDWLEWWVEFLTTKWNKAVNRDLWRQTLSFAQKSLQDESLSFWSEEGSWPSVIDEFVKWVRTEKRAGEAMEE